ncbi:MAG: adenylate/guanylate cyclase domain-containing protein [Betaproteobacteria bacterium]|nr:adenylate/guanylate cyclase domain-containing protein [Betaproteobacteria bacterium]
MKKHIVRIGMGVALVLIFLLQAAKWFELPLIQRLEAIVYDTRLTLTMPRTVDQRIVILDIDEKSLAEKEKGGEGRWPWPRDRLALLLDKLFDHYQIAIVGLDVVFSERDESSGIKVLQQLAQKELRDIAQFQSTLKQLQPQLEYDEMFASRMRNRPVVLGYTFSRDEATVKGQLPAPVLPAGTFGAKNINFHSFGGHTANLGELQKAAAGAGHFSIEPDTDGILRRVPMLAEFRGAYYEALSLAIVRMIIGSPNIVPGYPSDKIWSKSYSGLEWLEAGPLRIPVDERVTALVPYRGGERSFKYVSAVDVLTERADVADLKGKIVLLGTTAPGLLDLRATPVENIYPGVEIHANMIAGMLDRNIKQKPPYVVGAEFVLLLIAGLAMALLLPLLNPLKSLLVTVAVLVLVLFTNLIVFHYGNLVLPLASGLVMIALLFGLNMSYGYFVEARGKRQITGLFGQYVPPELVDEMAKNPEHFSMEGESRELTVLFTDVRGFTTISEGLDPKQLSQLMNEFLTPLTEIIYKHRGTIDKYMGDCIMAFWGAPLPDPNHAKNGILAGLEMQETLKRLQPEFKARSWPEIRIGVGLNTGRMSVGNMGSRIRLAYTVMGDAVNLASRLEGITKEYGADIIVGEGTKDAAPDFVFRELDRVRVKGKDEAVAIFEPLGLQGQVEKASLDEIRLYAQFLRLYRAQVWDQAELQLYNLQKMAPGNALYSQTFVERIAYLRANPPGEGWDGAFTFKTK